MNIYEQLRDIEKQMIGYRRHFHENPELSGEEEKTVEFICNKLKELGIEYVNIENGGVLGFINFDTYTNDDRTVLIRADIDALPVQEEEMNLKEKKESISKVEGKMHACGHDAHAAMLLAAAEIIQNNKSEFPGRILLMFERGEEKTNNYVEILRYIDREGILVDSCYGTHVGSEMDTNTIGISPGPTMAGALPYKVTFKGVGGHSSHPEKCINPLNAFHTAYAKINDFRMENVSPFRTFTSAICSVDAGNAPNVIPETVSFQGAARFFYLQDAAMFIEEVKRICEDAAKLHKCEMTEFLIHGLMIPTDSDEACTEMFINSMKEHAKELEILPRAQTMGSETFGSPLSLWPGVFTSLGVRNEEKGMAATHHNPHFDIDESGLIHGAASMIIYAKTFLASDIDTSKSPNLWKGSVEELLEFAKGIIPEGYEY